MDACRKAHVHFRVSEGRKDSLLPSDMREVEVYLHFRMNAGRNKYKKRGLAAALFIFVTSFSRQCSLQTEVTSW